MTPDAGPEDALAEAERLIAGGRAAEAARRLSRRIEAGKGGLLARQTLVRAQIAARQPAEAVATARGLVALAPDWAEGAATFGRALAANGALPAAIAELQRALRLDPELADGEMALAELWASAGEADAAAEHLDAARRKGADEAGVAATARRIAAIREAPRSDPGYVRHLFDQFSGDYDARMRGALGYRAPEILLDLGLLVSGGRLRRTTTLDMGCGTGLAAPAFRPFATRLTGVDLSPLMLAQAAAGGLYDDLAEDDLETYLARTRKRFGRIVASDVLIYLGDLTALFAGVRRVLKPGGLFLFTVERLDEGDEAFALLPTKRWAHSAAYVKRQAEAHGLDPRGLVQCTPRHNKGAPVQGLACALFG